MQAVASGTTSSLELQQRYGADVVAWLEADQSVQEHSSRPQPIAETADLGVDAGAVPGVGGQPRSAASARSADVHVHPAPGAGPAGTNRPAATAAGPGGPKFAHGSISAAAAPSHQQTAPQNGGPAAARSATGRLQQAATTEAPAGPPPAPPNAAARSHWRFFAAGAVMAVILHTALHWAMQLPLVRRLISRFIWMKPSFPWATASQSGESRLHLVKARCSKCTHDRLGIIFCGTM
jgi:hypothetical protein